MRAEISRVLAVTVIGRCVSWNAVLLACWVTFVRSNKLTSVFGKNEGSLCPSGVTRGYSGYSKTRKWKCCIEVLALPGDIGD